MAFAVQANYFSVGSLWLIQETLDHELKMFYQKTASNNTLV